MDLSLATVVETLADEFGGIRISTVVSVLSACVDEFPYGGPHFIEQAARARLSLLAQPQRVCSAVPGRDALDVSLHDSDLAAEVELTASLMVAANESASSLAREDVDRILGVRPDPALVIRHPLPAQQRRHF
jgi:hypothetical protein